ESLSSNLMPARVVKFTFFDVAKVLLAGVLSLVAAVALLGFRADLSGQIFTFRFFIECLGLLALALVSIYAALRLSVPDLDNKKFYKWPIFAFSILAILTGYSFVAYSNPFLYLGHGFVCLSEILLIGLAPAAILFFLIRRAAALKRDIVGALVLMAGAAFGWFGTQLTCADTTPLHNLFWHFIPFIFISVAGIYISNKILRKI
ncbi:MAG: NrsF family protein, partial [Bdellovibrionaceae bacterium]|nr:NrsF family protein [Pseudobdellovibrionaceae bacterium]